MREPRPCLHRSKTTISVCIARRSNNIALGGTNLRITLCERDLALQFRLVLLFLAGYPPTWWVRLHASRRFVVVEEQG